MADCGNPVAADIMICNLLNRLIPLGGANPMSDDPDQRIDSGCLVGRFTDQIEESLCVLPSVGHRPFGFLPLRFCFRLMGKIERGSLSGFELGRKPTSRFRRL
jgi:hypothetical protein